MVVIKDTVVLLVFAVLYKVRGHGRLVEPPSRSSMWRFGYNTPRNYQDNELYCGGFQNQWNVNGGKCGICGDPWQGPRENEAGGKYATGNVVCSYTVGEVITIRVQVTANHLGWFEFRLCPNNDYTKPATKECLDAGLLQMADGQGSRYPVGSAPGFHDVKVKLSNEVICSQCVLQWKYHTGNRWGIDADGNGCVGCGAQEEFYGCADVTIKGINGETPSFAGTTAPRPTPTRRTSTKATLKTTVKTTGSRDCRGTGAWKGYRAMDRWCVVNCPSAFCPGDYCECDSF